MLFAKSILKDNAGRKIIFDVKSSRYLHSWIANNGGEPSYMENWSFLDQEKNERG